MTCHGGFIALKNLHALNYICPDKLLAILLYLMNTRRIEQTTHAKSGNKKYTKNFLIDILSAH
jgi:hypothetical protein